MKIYGVAIIASILFAGSCLVSSGQERHRLYTETDSANGGGIKGHIVKPGKAIEQILAMPPDEPRFVYMGKITGNDRRGFLFEGLPSAKYNLFVIYEDEFYEGLELNKGEPSTLTAEDLKKIQYIITESDPYFTKKFFHRIEGITGRGNASRAIVTLNREENSTSGTGKGAGGKSMRRTFKLIWLKDVGPGWQVVQKRDLYPCWVTAQNVRPKHNYTPILSKIRVAGSVKDVGELDLVGTSVPVTIKAAPKTAPVVKPPAPDNVKDIRDFLNEQNE